jgi:RNA recognition motif. (a.k.a. RRM, RBD, or RNP domain)
MENQSSDQANRRPRGSRSGGRSRNRQGSSSNSGGSSSGGNRSRSRNRNRSGSRNSQPPKQTTGQKILSILTFGLLGKPKAKSSSQAKSSSRPAPAAKAPRESSKPQGRVATEEPKKTKRNRAEVTSNRLYVGNLDYSTGEAELTDLFRGVGNVLLAEVVTNPRTQQSKGFAFVEMGSIDEAKRAVSILDDQDFMGRKLIVSGARSEGPNDESDAALAGSSSEGRA